MTLGERFQNVQEEAKRLDHDCLQLDLDARFMTLSREERPCRVTHMSTSEMLIASDVSPTIGDHVIVYISELGRFEGKIVRHEASGYALSMVLTPRRRDKLLGQIEWLTQSRELLAAANRLHKRVVGLNQLTSVHFRNGKNFLARVRNISASDVTIELNATCAKLSILIGSEVLIGSKAAKIVRLDTDAFVANFQ